MRWKIVGDAPIQNYSLRFKILVIIDFFLQL
jgi:hypothetical protein